MRAMKQSSIVCGALVSGLLVCSLSLSAARADVLESARMLPDDTMVMVSVESVKDLGDALKKTSLWDFWKDPAIQQVVGEAEKKIRAQIDTKLKEFWHKAKMDTPPEEIPYPEGRLVFGLSLAAPPAPADPNEDDPGPQVQAVLLADMGSRAAQARQIVQALSANVVSAAGTVQKKELAGIEMDVRMPPEDQDEPMVCYGFKDNWLLVTVDETCRTDFTEAVARRVGRSLPESLGDKPGFRDALRTLGEADVHVFVNPDALKTLVAARAKNQASVQRIIKGLGLANVTGIAGAVRVAGDKSQEMCVKGLIGVQGSLTGIPALLGPASAPLKVSDPLLTRDAVGFVYANYDPGKLFDDINKIVRDAAFQDLNMIAQAGMAATAGDGGQPPVQLRDDVFAQLGAPLLVTWKADRPYTITSGLKFLVALPVRDGNRLDTTLGRIHKAFLGTDPKLRRELLNHTLYLLTLPGRTGGATQIAFSVAGDHLVAGPVEEVEQAIRNLQKEPDNTLTSDPVFRTARERLPSQASLYYYRNDRLNGEIVWATLKEMIRLFADKGKSSSAAPRKEDAPDSADEDAPDPVEKMLQELVKSIEVSRLPEFKAVEKYWGTTVGFVQNRPEGIYWETTSLKPVQE